MAKTLPSRPNLDHLRKQAKTLLDDLRAGHAAAIEAVTTHLPAAKRMKPAAVRAAGFRLADAQLVVARQSGFASWPGLSRHVEHLRALEGEWRFERLEADGSVMPASMIDNARLLIDGDRFRTESPEATYEGVFTIDVDAKPPHIDIEFVEGPEAGNSSHGLFELDGDRLTLCLTVRAGGARPTAFAARRGSGHALERLRRASAARPANVTGGTRSRGADRGQTGVREGSERGQTGVRQGSERGQRGVRHRSDPCLTPAGFDVPMTPLLARLQGEWTPTELVMDGKPMPTEWLAFGLRTTVGNEMTVTFNGQPMAHAKMRLDESAAPVAVDYLNLSGRSKGSVSFGIMDWTGDEVRFLIAAPGDPRPSDFRVVARTATLSRWRRR